MDNLILKTIADNPALFEAVKEAVLAEFDIDRLDTSQQDNHLLGEIVRARLEGIKKVEEAFRKIGQHKSVEPAKTEVMPGR
jgi:hypothetical protein